MAVGIPVERATLWGHLTFNYLTEIMAEGVYGQTLSFLGDPDVRAKIDQFLKEEQHHALGLRNHMAEVGPTIPEPLVDAFRNFSRLVGTGLALRGTGAFMDHVRSLEGLGENWYGQLVDRFPQGSVEAERYKQFKAQEELHSEWLDAHKADKALDARASQAEVVEFASIVPASVEEVFAFYTDTRSITPLMGMPTTCPEGVTTFGEGAHYHLRIGVPPFQVQTDAHILKMDAPHFYIDKKTQVPFDLWEHHHHFTPLGPRETLLSDRLFVKPKFLPPVPETFQPSPWKLGLLVMLWFRHRNTQTIFRRNR